MQALLICPGERPEVGALAEAGPLVNLRILGNPFIHYWIEHLAASGIKEITVMAVDRPDQVRSAIGSGAQWGVSIHVVPASEELTCEAAEEKYHESNPANRLGGPNQIVLADHFPGCENQKPFSGYAEFFSAIHQWLLKKGGETQIGAREIKPGIWIGLRTQIASDATIRAPCWIGQNVLIKAGAELGPMAFVESEVVVEKGAAISESWVSNNTFVGELIHLINSFALGNTLIKIETSSILRVPDKFLLCGLKDKNISIECGTLFGRFAAWVCLAVTFPFALITILKAKLSKHRVLRSRRATVPAFVTQNSSIIYHEFANASGWWKRWPQLWNVARGEFTWVGNRPLTHIEAGKLTNEFERLWLASPIGLVSQGDAEGCAELASDEARAHASFYAAQANWRLDLTILFRVFMRLVTRKSDNPVSVGSTDFKERPFTLAAR